MPLLNLSILSMSQLTYSGHLSRSLMSVTRSTLLILSLFSGFAFHSQFLALSARATRRYGKPAWRVHATVDEGEEIAVEPTVVWGPRPFD
jgi:poly-beta-hydroxyalkanoate depolymerase